jgi:hypothetical protein
VSGRRAFFSDQDARLKASFTTSSRTCATSILSYAAPDNARNGELHRIRVEVPGHGTVSGHVPGLPPAVEELMGTSDALSVIWRIAPKSQPPRTTFKSNVDLVPVDVNVIDKTGRPVSDLTAGDFTLSVDGKPRTIASAQFIAVQHAIETAPPKPLEYDSTPDSRRPAHRGRRFRQHRPAGRRRWMRSSLHRRPELLGPRALVTMLMPVRRSPPTRNRPDARERRRQAMENK